MTYKGLPLYKIIISTDYEYAENMELGMETISLVDDPAIEVSALKFQNEEPKEIKFSVDEEKGVIFGPAIICGKPIFRRGGMSGSDYYVVFERDQIEKIIERYSKLQRWNCFSLQHSGENIEDVVMVSMFMKDTANGINPKGYEDSVTDYSLFVGFKILDNDLWTKLRTSNDFNGFSIEILSELAPTDNDPTEYSKEEPDELDSFVNSILYEDKKKVDFVSESEIDRAIDNGKVVEITTDGDTHNAQVLEQGVIDGKKVAVYYIIDPDNPSNEKWQVKNLSDISDIKITSVPINQNWEELMDKPSYKAVEDILDDMVVPKTATVPNSVIDQSIEDGLWVTINYNDEKPNPFTGARQCFIVAHGISKKGNECLRVMERYGASRSVTEEGNSLGWRLMLTKRVVNIRPMPYLEKWDNDDLLADYNPYGDRSMDIVINHYKPSNYK